MRELKLLVLKLRRLLYSRGQSGDDTEDLIQEAFLRLKQYDRERTVVHPEAFLVRTVLNLLTDQRRKKRMAVSISESLETLVLIDPSPPPDAVCEGRERLRHFKEGLQRLSPRQREVFVLNRIEGHGFAHIAQELGITVSMAEKHAARAMFSLAEWMDRDAGVRGNRE